MKPRKEFSLRNNKEISDTFNCGACGNFRTLIGRKFLRKDGRRVIYQCARCFDEAKLKGEKDV